MELKTFVPPFAPKFFTFLFFFPYRIKLATSYFLSFKSPLLRCVLNGRKPPAVVRAFNNEMSNLFLREAALAMGLHRCVQPRARGFKRGSGLWSWAIFKSCNKPNGVVQILYCIKSPTYIFFVRYLFYE